MIKILCALTFNLLISLPIYAVAVEQKDIKFKPDTKSLLKGDVHYALEIVSTKKFKKKYPDLRDFDSLAFLQEPDVKMVISKTAYIVDKPAGFFDHLNTVDENFISHILGEQKVKKLAENEFRISVPGETGYFYKMKTFFDSDDISTLPNPRAIRAVTQAKKLDVISQSASSISYKELTQYSKYLVGGIQIHSYIPIKENKTLVLNYSLFAVKKHYALEKILKQSLREEVDAQKDLINSYK